MRFTGLSALGQRTAPPAISWLMQLTLDRPKLISLAAGFTDHASLPVSETTRLLRGILENPRIARNSLQYGSTAGDPALRKLTVDHLRKLDSGGKSSRGIYSPENVLITHGSQQLLYLATEALCDPGDIVLVEDPTYFVFLGILQSRGMGARGVKMEADGLDLGRLRRVLEDLRERGLLSRVKLLYLVSYFQNPSGITTSIHKKKAALEILKEFEREAGHAIYLLEDAAYRELRFDGPEEPSALTLSDDRVIYAGTYSKPFATGIRVGYGIIPEPLLTVLTRVKGNHDFGTSHLLQQILREALESGAYEKHLAVLRRRYRAKARVLARALELHFPREVQWQKPTGGLYIWAKTKTKTGRKSSFFNHALEQNVLYVPGELCYADDPTRRVPHNEMRISFGSASEREIREGIRRLGAVLQGA
jgi:2-aminoadipate transaminase